MWVQILPTQVLLHQRLVGLDDLVQELLAILLRELDHLGGDGDRLTFLPPSGTGVRAHVEDVHDAADLVLRPDRQMNGDAARRELVLDLRQRAVEVGAFAVEHVHEQDPRQPELVGEVLDARSAHLQPHDRVDDDQRSLHDAERAAGLALKARITRNVDEVDLAALPARVGERQRDRHLPLLLVLVPVGDRGAGVDRTQSIDLVGLIQQRLDEGRLARPAMADDGDVADLSGLDWGHGRPFLLVMVWIVRV